MTIINFLTQWYTLLELLSSQGYQRWQWQYDVNHQEGFHAWFRLHDRPDVEVVTHDEDVYKAIMQYENPEK